MGAQWVGRIADEVPDKELCVMGTQDRNYCRFLCPYGVLQGLIGTLGFYKTEVDREKCIECGACDRNCEMGMLVSSLVKKSGMVKVPDCVGCGRCVSICPKALEFKYVRSYLRKPVPHRLENPPLLVKEKSA